MKNFKWSYKFSLVLAILALVLVVALAMIPGFGFREGKASTAVTQVKAVMDDSNSLIFHIQGLVQTSGKVMLEYWSDNTGHLTTQAVDTNGNSFSIEVMRLRAKTHYNYRLYLVGSDNTPVKQFEGTFTTGPLPKGLQEAKINLIQGQPTYNLVLLDFNDTDFNGMAVIDQDNQIVWYYQHDLQVFTFDRRDNGNLVFNEISFNIGYSMVEITPDGRKVTSIDDRLSNGSICAPHGRWHHEMLLQPDNKVLTLGSEIRTVNINGTDTLQTGGTVEQWDMTQGTVTRLFSLFDLLDPTKDRRPDSDATGGFFWQGSQGQYVGVAEDWNHANSLFVMPDGNILMSIRHLDQVIAVKPDFSGIAWKLGGPESDFTFPDPNDQFYHQHYARTLPNGNLLLFDNGNLRPTDQGGQYSRALELQLDFKTMQAHKVWEYRNQPDLYSSAVGSVVRLENGHTVVDFGFNDVNNTGIYTLVEADSAGNPVATTQISAPGKGEQYRAIPINNINGEKEGAVTPGQ